MPGDISPFIHLVYSRYYQILTCNSNLQNNNNNVYVTTARYNLMNAEIIHPGSQPATWGFSATLIWSIVIALGFMIIQILVLILFVHFEYPDLSPQALKKIIPHFQTNGDVLSFATLATFFGANALLFGIIKLKKSSNIKRYLALNTIRFTSVRFWFLVLTGFVCLSELVTHLLGKPLVPEFATSIYVATDSLWLLWIAIVLAGPVFEELFFRGFLITGLSSTFIRPTGAIILSSIAWAVIHTQYDLYGIVTIFIFGLLLGYARVKTNSTLLTMGLHMFMNFVAMIETSIVVS